MKTIAALLAGICILAVAGTATASPAPVACHRYQMLTVYNQAGVPAGFVDRMEHAVEDETIQVSQAWPGTPCAVFVPSGGWRIHLKPMRKVLYGYWGYHMWVKKPYAVVGVFGGYGNVTSDTFAHEVIEMLHDPYGLAAELCDPVDDLAIILDGVEVADWVTPNWFHHPRTGELDYGNALQPNGSEVLPNRARLSRVPAAP